MGVGLNRILERLVWNGLWLVGVAGPVVLGSVHWPTRIALASVSCAILVAYALLMFRKGYRVRYDGFLLLSLAAGALMLVQLLPLPGNLLESLSPAAWAGVQAARDFGFDVPARVSLDPAGTVGMLCMIAGAVAAYLVAFNLAHRDGEGHKVLAIVAAAGSIVALIVLAQAATKSGAILWIYTPEHGMAPKTPFFSTFVNNNNAAAFLNLSMFVLIGQWRKAQFGRTKGIIGLMVLLTLAASVMMLSRGGVVALLGAAAFMAILSRWAGAQKKSLPTPGVTAFGVFLTVLVVVLFLIVFNLVLTYTEGTSLVPFVKEEAKITAWEKAASAVDAYSTVGAGAGAFATAFSPFNDFAPMMSFQHAENELVELMVELGTPAAILLVMIATVLIWRRLSIVKADSYYSEALCGLVAVFLQNLADFSLRVPGVLFPVALTLGALSGQFARDFTKQRSWSMRLGALKLIPVAATVFMLVIVGGGFAEDNDAPKAYTAAKSLRGEGEGDMAEAERSVAGKLAAMHPHDSHLYSLFGSWRLRAGDTAGARRFYSRAQDLCPACIVPAAGMARYYVTIGEPKKALAELLRVAVEVPEHRLPIFASVDGARISEGDVVDAWGEHIDVVRDYARYLDYVEKPEKLESLVRTCTRQIGYDHVLMDRLGRVYLRDMKLDDADLTATYLMALFPERQEGFLLQARVLTYRNELDDALAMYEEGRTKAGEQGLDIALEMLNLLARTRNWDRFEALSAEIRTLVRDDAKHIARYHQIMAIRDEMFGRDYQALRELDQAEAADPFGIDVLLKKADVQRRLGRADKAAAEYRKALKIDPNHPGASEGLRSLEMGGQVPSI